MSKSQLTGETKIKPVLHPTGFGQDHNQAVSEKCSAAQCCAVCAVPVQDAPRLDASLKSVTLEPLLQAHSARELMCRSSWSQ